MKSFICACTALMFTLSGNAQSKAKNNAGKPGQYAIAYNVAVKDSTGKSNYEVFSMNMDGTNKTNLTRHADVAWTYRAYGDRLFFISDRDTCYRCFFLYETDINGNGRKKIADLQLEDSWMDFRNEGKELIVSGRIGKAVRYQLFIINTSTGAYRQITNDIYPGKKMATKPVLPIGIPQKTSSPIYPCKAAGTISMPLRRMEKSNGNLLPMILQKAGTTGVPMVNGLPSMLPIKRKHNTTSC